MRAHGGGRGGHQHGRGSGQTSLKLKAGSKGALKFDKTRLRAAPGQVTIRLTNPSSSGKPHAVEIEGSNLSPIHHGRVLTIDPKTGDKSESRFTAQSGRWMTGADGTRYASPASGSPAVDTPTGGG